MKKTATALILLLLLGSILQAQSPLFGPSKSELEMKRQLEYNRNTITLLKQRVRELNERVDGLTTVIEGLNATIGELQTSQHSQPVQNFSSSDYALLEAKIAKLDSECVKKGEMASLPVHKKDTKKYQNSSSAEKGPTKGKHKATVSLDIKSNSTLYSEGVRLFQKHKYNEAKKRFKLTESKGYKPAASNYYLGEIAYYTKNYNDAIFYFKKSAGIYDQASYIDTLLLHTAISLEKTGDKSQAKIFYQTIIDGYPEKKSARIAKKKIRNL